MNFIGKWTMHKKRTHNLKKILKATGHDTKSIAVITNTKVKMDVLFDNDTKIMNIKTRTRVKNRDIFHIFDEKKREYETDGSKFTEICKIDAQKKELTVSCQYHDGSLSLLDTRRINEDGTECVQTVNIIQGKVTETAIITYTKKVKKNK